MTFELWLKRTHGIVPTSEAHLTGLLDDGYWDEYQDDATLDETAEMNLALQEQYDERKKESYCG